jgi:Fe-S oxidoreductase
MEKVNEPKSVEEAWYCPRCKQSHCGDCVDKCMVDFDIMDEPDGFNQRKIQWEGLTVCPWCYNQLVDKQLTELTQKESE